MAIAGNPVMVSTPSTTLALSRHHPRFVPLKAEVRRRAFRSALDACQICPASLPGTAGVIGAAAVFKKDTYGVV